MVTTLSDINAAFTAGLQFDPTSHATCPITVSIQDHGNTGEESPPLHLSATSQVTVPIVP